MRLWIGTILFGACLLLTPAFADEVPLGDDAFTAYIQHKLQLYSAAPVRVIGPFTVAIGSGEGANLVFAFKPLHDACVKDPAHCADKAYDYVQDAASRFPSANHEIGAGEAVPSDRAGFMAFVAGELAKLLPGDAIDSGDMTLTVTRPGGHPIAFDQRGYYQLCRQAQFECATALRQSLARTAAWLAPPEAARLRASLHLIADCRSDCRPTRDDAPMGTFGRLAFANLEEVCFKQLDNGVVPLTNADLRDLGLAPDAALALCEAGTHTALGPLVMISVAPGQVGTIAGPYAASRVLFPGDLSWLTSGGPVLVALPARDVLIYTRGDAPEQVAALRARARELFTAGLGIGTDIYRWTSSGWELVPAPP